MRTFIHSLYGLALGGLFVLLAGALGVQVIGQEAGAVYDVSNTVVGITAPRVPWLPLLALATLAALVLFFVTVAASRTGELARRSLVAGFLLSTAALVLWGFLLDAAQLHDGDVPPGVRQGWMGWLAEGGTSSTVHVIALVALGSLWLRILPARRSQGAEPTGDDLSVTS